MNRVRWLTPPRDIAAMVMDASSEGFKARLFHFGHHPREMKAELYLLDKGSYQFELTHKHEVVQNETFRVSGQRTKISFALPAKKVCDLF